MPLTIFCLSMSLHLHVHFIHVSDRPSSISLLRQTLAIPGSSTLPFNSNHSFLLGRPKKGHAIGFVMCGNPWICTSDKLTLLRSPFIVSKHYDAGFSAIHRINSSTEAEQHRNFKLSTHAPMWSLSPFGLFIVLVRGENVVDKRLSIKRLELNLRD